MFKSVYDCGFTHAYWSGKSLQGRIRDFHLGGGGGGGMCPHAHYERRTELNFGRGPGPAQGPWKLWGCFNDLSCYLSSSFKHFDTKVGKKK